ncbi:MAG: hypothetical protein HQM08_04945 [Candidatus Riflebacteria bacterium]|nr:hypothetical protein [Candidatus Riflebacteria bacterium]
MLKVPCLVNFKMKFRKFGSTLIEILVVTLLFSIILGTLTFLLFRTFKGTKKGVDTLTILQEQSKLMSYVKHDLRTLIIGDYPPPEVVNDTMGTVSFSFYKVLTVDVNGLPIPVKIVYSRENTGKTQQKKDGSTSPSFSILRNDGQNTERFMSDIIASFSIELLDRRNYLINVNPVVTRKIRLSIETFSSDLFSTNLSLYSPFVSSVASGSEKAWLNNYRCRSYSPGAAVVTYSGVSIPSNELISIGAGIALSRERKF